MATRFSADGQAYTRLNTLGSQSNYTFALWGKVSVNRTSDSTMVSLYSDGSDFGLFMARTGLSQSFVDEFTAFSLSSLTVGAWYFMGCSVTANTGTLVQRTEGATMPASTSWTAGDGFTSAVVATTLAIGTDLFGNWFNGAVCGVKFWTAALTADELDRESRQLLPVRWADIAGAYPLASPETRDYSGLSRTLTGGTGATTEDGPAVPFGPSPFRAGLNPAVSRSANW